MISTQHLTIDLPPILQRRIIITPCNPPHNVGRHKLGPLHYWYNYVEDTIWFVDGCRMLSHHNKNPSSEMLDSLNTMLEIMGLATIYPKVR